MKNTGQIKTLIATAAMAAVLATGVQAQTPAKLEQTHAMAAAAKSGPQHAAVAKQYRLHAETFGAQAAEHERNVRELTRSSGAAVIKWPGLASGQLQKEKAKAIEARRAEREARELAARHLQLAVEAQATPEAVAGD